MESPFQEAEKKEAWLPLGLRERHKIWRVGLDLCNLTEGFRGAQGPSSLA